MKTCAICKIDKPLTEYHKDPKGRNGLRRMCKPCAIAVDAKWRKANPEKARAKQRRWRASHKTVKTKICLNCGVEFPANGTARKYCTDACKSSAKCSADGCDDPVSTKELCRRHYARQWEARNRESLRDSLAL